MPHNKNLTQNKRLRRFKDSSNIDHLTMIKKIASSYPGLPLIVLAEDALVPDATGNISRLNRDFKHLHLQALSRNSMRRLVANYNAIKKIGPEDVVLSGLAEHLESINVHRTPLNCYTLLRVLDSSYNEKLINKSKLLKAFLFILFTDSDSFSFSSNKPEVEECTFVLGCFCKELIEKGTRIFDAASFTTRLNDICKTHLIVLNVEAMLNVLFDNNILIKRGEEIEFRHRYWILYFAAEWMRHDDDFRQFVLKDRNYVRYPEILEFYAGIDGKRTDAMETILADLSSVGEQVEEKIGIGRSFDPLSSLLWNPSDEYIQKAKTEISENIESSNLPAAIKDEHADKQYQSIAPYDQSISKFLDDYSVSCLLNSIKAASRALRSSHFVDVELRNEVVAAIFKGWQSISRVAFWLSPLLAREGRAIHDGFAIMLAEGFSTDIKRRFNQILTSNPFNIVRMLGGDLASKKLGPLIEKYFQTTDSNFNRHMTALFIITSRPVGWYGAILNYINLLHPRSFFLGDIFTSITNEIKLGDLEPEEEPLLRNLVRAILSKREYMPKTASEKEIPPGKLLNADNELPIDKLLKGNRKRWPDT